MVSNQTRRNLQKTIFGDEPVSDDVSNGTNGSLVDEEC